MSEAIAPSRSVRIADLSPEKKRRLWTWIQQNDPDMQKLITGPEMATLGALFPGTSVVVDIDYVKRALA
jgi:hypothetical protein